MGFWSAILHPRRCLGMVIQRRIDESVWDFDRRLTHLADITESIREKMAGWEAKFDTKPRRTTRKR
jgi:hypothetical protein